MNNMTKCLTVLLAVTMLTCLSLADEPSAAVPQRVELGRRYQDDIHGFSLRIPADAERIRETSQARLVTWQGRDATTGAISWTFHVFEAVEEQESIVLQAYAESLAARLSQDNQYKIESTVVTPLGGKPAIVLEGIAGVQTASYQKQAWVLAEPQRFLVFVISGPAGNKASLNALFDAMIASLQVVNPSQAQELRRQNLDRGRTLLSKITAQRLQQSVHEDALWYVFRLNGKAVGYMLQRESIGDRDKIEGVEVRTWVVMQLPDDQPRLLKRILFTTADRGLVRWEEKLQVGKNPPSIRIDEQGVKQADMVLCTISQDHKNISRKKPVPKAVEDIFLPRAMQLLLGRLVDLDAPAAYGFATYATEANDYDMTTFTVVGPEALPLGGRTVETIKATEQQAADAEPATLWLNRQGVVLKMTTDVGLTVELATKEEVGRQFSDASTTIASMGN